MLMNIDTYLKQQFEKSHFTTFRFSLWSLSELHLPFFIYLFFFFFWWCSSGRQRNQKLHSIRKQLCMNKYSGGGKSSRHALCQLSVSSLCAGSRAVIISCWCYSCCCISHYPALDSRVEERLWTTEHQVTSAESYSNVHECIRLTQVERWMHPNVTQ